MVEPKVRIRVEADRIRVKPSSEKSDQKEKSGHNKTKKNGSETELLKFKILFFLSNIKFDGYRF